MAAFRVYLTAIHSGDPFHISWGTPGLTQTASAHGLSYSARWDTGAGGLGPHVIPPGSEPAYVPLDYLTGARPGLSFLGGSNHAMEQLTAGLGSGLLIFEATCDTAVRAFVVEGDTLPPGPGHVPCRVLTGHVTALSPVGATPTSGTRHLLVVGAGDLACAGYPGGKAAPFLLHRMSEFTKAWLALFAWHLTNTDGDTTLAMDRTNAHSVAATWARMGSDMLRLLWVSKHNKKDATFTQPVPLPDLADGVIGEEDEVFVGMKPGPAVAWCNSWCSDLYRAPCNLFCPGAVQVCRVAFNADPRRHTLRLDEDTTDIATDLCGGKDATPVSLSAALLATDRVVGLAEAAVETKRDDDNEESAPAVDVDATATRALIVATLNVQFFNGMRHMDAEQRGETILSVFRANGSTPDVLCLQEVWEPLGPKEQDTCTLSIDGYLCIAQMLCESLRVNDVEGKLGTAMWVKVGLPVRDCGTLSLTTSGRSAPRCCTYGTVCGVTVANVHLTGGRFDDLNLASNVTAKADQVTQIMSTVHPHVILGDFNGEPTLSGSLSEYATSLSTAVSASDVEEYFTGCFKTMERSGFVVQPSPGSTCAFGTSPDWICTRPEAVECSTPIVVDFMGTKLSDHDGVVAAVRRK